ncbi:unnamed protein product [Acidithrix sp. C25]|nr:unnamed protein product [Acidithrix sp. C25]
MHRGRTLHRFEHSIKATNICLKEKDNKDISGGLPSELEIANV